MPITERDNFTRARAINVIRSLKGKKSDKDIIYAISAQCSISYRTAYEHYHAFKAQASLSKEGFKEECFHPHWSVPASTPGGLVKECLICHETKSVKTKKLF